MARTPMEIVRGTPPVIAACVGGFAIHFPNPEAARTFIAQVQEMLDHHGRERGIFMPQATDGWKPGWLKVLYRNLTKDEILIRRPEQAEDWFVRANEGSIQAVKPRTKSEDDEF